MKNNLIEFNFGSTTVRTVEIDGEIWFVAADVCKVLDHTNPSRAVLTVDEDDRANFELGGGRTANIINESGLYTLLLRSDKPEAKPFRRWVTKEVLPAIRRQGLYQQPNRADDSISVEALREILAKTVCIPVPEYLALAGTVRKTHDAPKPFSEAEKAIMEARFAEGKGATTIAREINRHETSVRGFLKKLETTNV